VDRRAAACLHDRLREFQNEFERQRWGPVRLITNWNLLIVEKALAVFLNGGRSPAAGYRLVADYCRHYDPHSNEALTGPSAAKLRELARFMNSVEGRDL
jgi:hypothetical protein